MSTVNDTTGTTPGNVNIGDEASHTSNHVIVGTSQNIEESAKVRPSELTAGEIGNQLPILGIRTPEHDVLVSKFRVAQANAFFDPEAMALLEGLSHKKSIDFAGLAEIIRTPEMWVKLAILVRAYLIEPLDNGVRVTPEGVQALEKIRSYLAILGERKQDMNHEGEP